MLMKSAALGEADSLKLAVHVFWVHLFHLGVPTQMFSTPLCSGGVPSSGAEDIEVHCSPSGYPRFFAKHKPQQSYGSLYNMSSTGRGRGLSVWFTVKSLNLNVGRNTFRVRE